MRVKCIAAKLTADQVAALALSHVGQDFHVTAGKEYTVIGLDLSVGSSVQGTGVWVHLVSDFGRLTWAPLTLFAILDGRASRYWVARSADAGLTLWPPALYQEYFHDDLSEDAPDVVAAFKRIVEKLEAEAQHPI